MSMNCPKTCCEAASQQAAAIAGWCSVLSDVQTQVNCTTWKLAGYCTEYRGYMADNCAATCKVNRNATAEQCNAWASAGYCSDTGYKKYMQDNCAGSCCKLAEPTAYSKSADTYNQQGACSAWASEGKCRDSYAAWMFSNCQKTCGDLLCLNDKSTDCAAFATANYCTAPQYSTWMGLNCAKSCRNKNPESSIPCSAWSGYCTDLSDKGYASYMALNCPATCCKDTW